MIYLPITAIILIVGGVLITALITSSKKHKWNVIREVAFLLTGKIK